MSEIIIRTGGELASEHPPDPQSNKPKSIDKIKCASVCFRKAHFCEAIKAK